MDREQIVALNNEIAVHASRKELDEAMALFRRAIDQNSANSHTYAAAINANIRCGRMEGAEVVMEVMSKNGRKRDVIICTTMIKGYCQAGRVADAFEMLKDMTEKKPIIPPNIRTINTLLRGCVMSGDVTNAEALMARAPKDFKLQLDGSSWEYLTALLAQSLKLDKALPIVGRLRGDAGARGGLAAMQINVARAAAVLGEWKVCRRALTQAQAALDEDGTKAVDAPVDVAGGDAKKEKGAKGDKGKAATAPIPATTTASATAVKSAGGKRAWNPNEVDARRAESLELYREHSKAEFRAEIQTIEQFVERSKASGASAFELVFPYFLRLFPFSAVPVVAGQEDAVPLRKDLVKPVMRSVEEDFGLEIFCRRLTGKSCAQLHNYSLTGEPVPPVAVPTPKKIKKNKNKGKKGKDASEAPVVKQEDAAAETGAKEAVAKEGAKESKADVQAEAIELKDAKVEEPTAETQRIMSYRPAVAKSLDPSGGLLFDRIFSSSSGNAKKRPVKLEVCSGAGEWAVAQAREDNGSDWVTLELRSDRAYQTFTKAIFAGATNLCVLCGDATRVLPRHMLAGSISQLFVNHPEPPQQTGGGGGSQSAHLLDRAFFLQANRLLEPGGLFTIVTDNLWYGRMLMRLVASISVEGYLLQSEDLPEAQPSDKAGKTSKGKQEETGGTAGCDWRLQESENGVNLFTGTPGARAGHVVDASSYFDRLWKRGNLVERYFIVLRRVDASAHTATRKRALPAFDPANSTLTAGIKNSRIKFE